jgi:DNA-binding FrmR family transcriptional regulator
LKYIKGIVRLTAQRGNQPVRAAYCVSLYYRHRFPSEIISHCVWLYFRLSLSFRDVEELMSSRGVSLSYETVREWCLKFGQTYAKGGRRRSPRPGDQWHLDEVFLKINGRLHYLWRAVDQDGDVLDILVQISRDKKAAKKFFSQAIEGRAICPARDRHRQVEELQCGKGRIAAQRRALPAEVSKQPSREFTSANQVAGACDETVQICRTRAAFSLGVRNHYLTLPSGETSVER